MRACIAAFPTLGLLAVPMDRDGAGGGSGSRAAMLLAMVAGPPLWWRMQLLGLPDIGDPFDVKAFRAFTIPDDRNAYVLYRQAATRLKPWSAGQAAGNMSLRPWSKANPGAPPVGRGEPRGPCRVPPGQLSGPMRWVRSPDSMATTRINGAWTARWTLS